MWIWMKMLKISWTQKVINQEVLNTIHEETIFTSDISTSRLGVWYDMAYCTQLSRVESSGREEEDVKCNS